MARQRMRLISSFVLFAIATPALAWNKAGHMTTGAIAYESLMKQSPAAAKKVVDLLKEHPYYDERWKGRLADLPEADRDRALFMMAARWPDDARGDEEFHKAEWHYVNFPFKPVGQPGSVRTVPEDANNILRALGHNVDELRRTGTDSDTLEDRAVALSWIFHLVGDIHQPLHTTTLFTTEFPQGDRGGTRFYVRARLGTSPISLHSYWDDLLGGSDRFKTVRDRATLLMSKPHHQPDDLADQVRIESFDRWAVESVKLAKKVAYRDGDLEGSATKPGAPPLPDDYAAKVQPVAERQAVLAGFRLAALLKKHFE